MDPKQTSGDLKDGCQMNTFFNYLFQSEDELKKAWKKEGIIQNLQQLYATRNLNKEKNIKK